MFRLQYSCNPSYLSLLLVQDLLPTVFFTFFSCTSESPLRSTAQLARGFLAAHRRKLSQDGYSSNHRTGYRHLDTDWKWRRYVKVLPHMGWRFQVGRCLSAKIQIDRRCGVFLFIFLLWGKVRSLATTRRFVLHCTWCGIKYRFVLVSVSLLLISMIWKVLTSHLKSHTKALMTCTWACCLVA